MITNKETRFLKIQLVSHLLCLIVNLCNFNVSAYTYQEYFWYL